MCLKTDQLYISVQTDSARAKVLFLKKLFIF